MTLTAPTASYFPAHMVSQLTMTNTNVDGKDCYKTTRHKLGENAKMAAEEQAALESAEVCIPTQSTVPLLMSK